MFVKIFLLTNPIGLRAEPRGGLAESVAKLSGDENMAVLMQDAGGKVSRAGRLSGHAR